MSVLKQLPNQIADPLAILRSTSQDNSLVILTEWKDGNTSIIIPLHLDKTGAVGIENRVASAYGKGNIKALIGASGENVLYTKNNEDINQLLSKWVQFPQAMADDILAKNSIQDQTPAVKTAQDTRTPFQREIARQLGMEDGGKKAFSIEDSAQETAEKVRDTLPQKARDYLKRTENAMLRRISGALDVQSRARRESADHHGAERQGVDSLHHCVPSFSKSFGRFACLPRKQPRMAKWCMERFVK